MVSSILSAATANAGGSVGTLKIKCKPKAYISVDGSHASLKASSKVSIVVDAGIRRVSAVADGYLTEVVKVDVKPNKVVKLEIFLVKEGQNRNEMAKISGGEVEIGVAAGRIDWLVKQVGGKPKDYQEAQPLHTITVKSFSIDKYEVTNSRYQKFVKAKGYPVPKHWKYGEYPDGDEDYPVVEVTWKDAQAYCKWAKKRLPTEEEWERAARGNRDKAFSFGPKYKSGRANIAPANLGGPTITGRYERGATTDGCHDMSGNVWEWTASDWKLYPGSPAALAPGTEKMKVVRGGSYKDPAFMATVFSRHKLPADQAFPNVGFRCVR